MLKYFEYTIEFKKTPAVAVAVFMDKYVWRMCSLSLDSLNDEHLSASQHTREGKANGRREWKKGRKTREVSEMGRKKEEKKENRIE